jgi:LysM repeat protein
VTFEPEQGAFAQVCPYLGLADDADSHATYSTEAHRCYKLPNPTRIALGHQETYCLGENHVACPVFQGEGIPATTRPPAAAPGAAAAGMRPQARAEEEAPARRVAAAPVLEPAGRPRPARAPGRPPPRKGGGVSMPVATIALFALALVVIALAFAVLSLTDDDGGGNQVGGGDALRTAQAQRTADAITRIAGTTPTAAATNATPSTPSTPTGAATPSPTGSAGRTYTIQSGDTCSGIAAEHNVSLQAFLQANNLNDDTCRALQPGQVVRIP